MREAQRYVLFYDSGDLSRAAEHFPAHRARYTEFMDRGVLLALGPFTDRTGSIAVFTTHEAAMDFASGDPFVEHGVVSGWQVREWRVVSPGDLRIHGGAPPGPGQAGRGLREHGLIPPRVRPAGTGA